MRVPKPLVIGWVLFLSLTLSHAADPERSVVRIITFSQSPDWDAPWKFTSVQESSGSGFVIKGKRIVSNAHVVSWARQIVVRRHQDPHPYVAKVEFIAHDCDLAVLTVEDEKFFDNLTPLEFGELPKVRSQVVTCGYPAGGQEISYTRGVVSRIEMQACAHVGNRQILAVQTDAAINPGNSGGPVLQDERVVGVAFQGLRGLENAGFFIPALVVERFLKDIEDGHYDGVPRMGVQIASLQNPAYRAALKLPDDDTGARVDSVLPNQGIEKYLRPEDVILRLGKFPVASDAKILFQGNRVSAALVIQLTQAGETLPVQIWRDGQTMNVEFPARVYDDDRAAGQQYDQLPRYLVYAGLVFTPLSFDYMAAAGGGWSEPRNWDLTYELFTRRQERPESNRPEPVVLATVLSDAVNANVRAHEREVVDTINGIRIEKLEDAIRALDTNTNAFDVISFQPGGRIESLNRAEVAKANDRILRTYNLTTDRRL